MCGRREEEKGKMTTGKGRGGYLNAVGGGVLVMWLAMVGRDGQ